MLARVIYSDEKNGILPARFVDEATSLFSGKSQGAPGFASFAAILASERAAQRV
jgi:hypothetical protein